MELIIVFSVIATLSTIGIASFVSYSKQQTLQASYLELLSTLNAAKSFSISQIKPGDCGADPLSGYRVALNFSGNNYSFYAECQGYEKLLKTSSLPRNVSFNSTLTTNSSILFPILSDNVSDCQNTCTITIDGYSDQRIIIISPTGLITGSQNTSSPGSTPTPTPTPAPQLPGPTPTPPPSSANPTPTPFCTNNSLICSGNTLQTCVNNSYVNVITCPANTTCNLSLTNPCTPNPSGGVNCGKVICFGVCLFPALSLCI